MESDSESTEAARSWEGQRHRPPPWRPPHAHRTASNGQRPTLRPAPEATRAKSGPNHRAADFGNLAREPQRLPQGTLWTPLGNLEGCPRALPKFPRGLWNFPRAPGKFPRPPFKCPRGVGRFPRGLGKCPREPGNLARAPGKFPREPLKLSREPWNCPGAVEDPPRGCLSAGREKKIFSPLGLVLLEDPRNGGDFLVGCMA